MNTIERKRLSHEAEMQLKALKKIEVWKNLVIAVSTIGVAVAYAGFAGDRHSTFLGILGVILILVGFVSAVILNLGIKNGRRNVEKIINVLNKENVT